MPAHLRARVARAFFSFSVAALTLGLVPSAQAQLAIHPENPHYFVDTATGKPVLVVGYNSIVPFASPDPVSGELGLDDLAGHRVMWARVWHLGDPWPWVRSNQPGGPGGNKFDLSQFNDAYFTSVKTALSLAHDRSLWAELHFFDKSSMIFDWATYPLARDNCINDIDSPLSTENAFPGFYETGTRPKLVAFQDAYVRKMIDETIALPHMVYEIENEHDGDHPVYAQHFADLVKSHLATAHPGLHRLVSYSTMNANDLDAVAGIASIDVLNIHCGGQCDANPAFFNTFIVPRWSWNKPINVDEFANSLADANVARTEAWTIITSGGHLHFEDPQYALPFDILLNIRTFLARSGWDFVHSAPDTSRVSGGYCMAAPASELLCYLPAGGSFDVTLEAATWSASFWNPRTGGFTGTAQLVHAGGTHHFTTPTAEDWVLHVRKAARPNPALVALPTGASPITVDGDPSDWPLAEHSGEIRAGDVGEGRTAALGIVDLVGFSAGHWTGGQYPPAPSGDLTARVRARHSASHLYFLVRVDDSDIQTPNGVASNWANDAVELYLDPANAGGEARMANSTSALQLVVDAKGQKAVYETTAGYASTVLAGVTAAATRDATGYWIEIGISKAVLSPALGATGEIGLDIDIHDNDANDAAQTTSLSWADPEISSAFPSKIPGRWGRLILTDTVGPGLDAGRELDASGSPGDGATTLSDAALPAIDGAGPSTGQDAALAGDGDTTAAASPSGCGCGQGGAALALTVGLLALGGLAFRRSRHQA